MNFNKLGKSVLLKLYTLREEEQQQLLEGVFSEIYAEAQLELYKDEDEVIH